MNEENAVAELVCAAAQLRGYEPTVTAGNEVTVTGPAGTTVVVLDDLIREAAAAPAHDRAALAADYLGTALADLETPVGPVDYTDTESLIRTRLYGDSTHDHTDFVHRTLAPGLVQRVLLDSVYTMTPITHRQLAEWPITEAELFALAEDNTLRDGRAEFAESDPAEDVPPYYLLSGGEYTTAHALWLCDYPVLGGRGAVFAIPVQLWLYAAPINNLDVLQTIWMLAQISLGRYEQDPRPVTPHLYHWENGRVTLAVHIERDGDTLRMRPTEEFQHLLNQLPR